MAVTLEVGVRDLLPELLANALILFGTLESAGAIATGTLQAVLYGPDYFRILIKSDSHSNTPFSFYYTQGVKGSSFLFSFSVINDTINKICLGGYL